MARFWTRCALGGARRSEPSVRSSGPGLEDDPIPAIDGEWAAIVFRIAEIPATSRYFRDASSVGPGAATVYGLKTLWTAARLVVRRLRFAATTWEAG